MKKIIKKSSISLLLLNLVMLLGCSKNVITAVRQNSVPEKMPNSVARSSNVSVGFLDSTATYVAITDAVLKEYYVRLSLISDSALLSPYEIISGLDAAGSPVYAVSSEGYQGLTHVTIRTEIDPQTTDHYLIGVNTCTCTSVSCENTGCNASLYAGICACTPCEGTCQKTSTATDVTSVVSSLQEILASL